MLEEKRVPYRVEKVNMRCYGEKPTCFFDLNPAGNIPVVKIDDTVITESTAILYAIENMFPEYRAMMPTEGPHAERVGELLQLERALFNHWMKWLVRESVDGDEMMLTFEALMSDVDSRLKESSEIEGGGGGFFLGSEVSMVDCMFAPFLERMSASVPYYKGLAVRGNPKWPFLQTWFGAMESLLSYPGISSDYYTHCHDLPPQIGGCESHGEALAFQQAIDGTDGVHWALPLPVVSREQLLQGYQPVLKGDDEARREAAARVIENAEALVSFCLRALGMPGPYMGSQLADPGNSPDTRFVKHMDCALRHVVAALLTHDGPGMGDSPLSPQVSLPKYAVGGGLAYLRERISVPRDMSWPAARQLRAHVTAVMRAL